MAVGTRFDYSVLPPIQELSPHAVVNAACWYNVTPNVRLIARIDNLFNANYEEIVGYGTAPFSAFGGVKIAFGGPITH